jgi:hypothetical protein
MERLKPSRREPCPRLLDESGLPFFLPEWTDPDSLEAPADPLRRGGPGALLLAMKKGVSTKKSASGKNILVLSLYFRQFTS